MLRSTMQAGGSGAAVRIASRWHRMRVVSRQLAGAWRASKHANMCSMHPTCSGRIHDDCPAAQCRRADRERPRALRRKPGSQPSACRCLACCRRANMSSMHPTCSEKIHNDCPAAQCRRADPERLRASRRVGTAWRAVSRQLASAWRALQHANMCSTPRTRV